MERKIFLTLIGLQRDEAGQETTTAFSAEAEYFEQNGSQYILYQETGENGSDNVKNIIKLKGHLLEVTKKGSVTSRMVFEEGAEHATNYVTPFGQLQLNIFTHSVSSFFSEDMAEITADYTLIGDQSPILRCNISIKMKFLTKHFGSSDR